MISDISQDKLPATTMSKMNTIRLVLLKGFHTNISRYIYNIYIVYLFISFIYFIYLLCVIVLYFYA